MYLERLWNLLQTDQQKDFSYSILNFHQWQIQILILEGKYFIWNYLTDYRPSEFAIELGRVVERGLRESRAIDTEALCLVAGEKVHS